MSSYSSRLQRHLKNQAKQLRATAEISHSEALDAVAIDFGFSGWKQATAHMARADARIHEAQASLTGEIARQAAELRALPGYPYRLEDRTGVRFQPADKQQIEAVARRLVLLQLYEDVHAPSGLCHSDNARLWFRRPMPFEDAADSCQGGPWKIRHLANALVNDPKGPAWFRAGTQPLTPESARDAVLNYLHALHSLSVIRALAGSPEEVLAHPGFKEFTGCVLGAILADQERAESLSALLLHAGICAWAQPDLGLIDPERLYWKGRQEPEKFHPSEGVSMLVGFPMHPRLRRPLNSLSDEQHQELSGILARLDRFAPGKGGLLRKLGEIRETLASWMALETGSEELANERYFSKPHAYRTVPFLAPAEEREARSAIQAVRNCIEAGYEYCTPRSRLLGQVIQVQRAFDRWMERTQGHWMKTTHKLLMDSIGLVAIDPKHEPLLESEAVWKQIELMGTSREANLIAAIRPHLFMSWKEDEEAQGYDFDAADADSEQSILEHLHGLAFYRYTGHALTRKQYEKEVHRAFYFEPEHIWFKQRKIG